MIRTLMLLLAVPAAADADWPFRPNEAADGDRLLDLRGLNEKQSGETGFVRLSKDGNSFVRGDGEPIRFWAIGSDIYRKSGDEMDRHCRFLARVGVNMVRLHATVAGKKEGQAITDVNRKEIDGIFRFIKAAKANGIYVTISPYYGHHPTPKSWKLAGYKPGQKPWGALFIDERMRGAYKVWTRELYATKNPHTGLAIKDDPTVAILQIHNEDSLFFWTAQALPAALQEKLAGAFAAWLAKKYGTAAAAKKAWGGAKAKGDAAGRVGLLSTWHMTRDWEGATAKRLRDQVRFLAEYQRDFYARMGRHLRETLGCRQLLNATNWRTANDSKLKAIERWTYAALDIDAENEYYGSDYQHIGENKGYRIDPGHYFVNESCLHKPLELTANFKTHVGHPFIVTETSWKHPNLYQSEGPFLISAYQSLGGVDAVYWFSANATTWLKDPRRLFWKVGDSHALDKWSCSTPMLIGMFPAAALVYRNGHLKEGEPVVTEARPLKGLWGREPAVIEDNEIYGVSRETEELKSPRRPDGRVSRAAFLVGPVRVKYGADAAETKVADFGKYLKPGTLLSNTGELTWDYRDGVCRMDAAKAQGVTGFLKKAGGEFKLTDVTVESNNEYASVSVVPLDGRPVASSRRLLVQVGTTCRLTGWEAEPARFDFKKQKIRGRRIVNSGRPPWLVADTDVTIHVRNPNITKAVKLTVDGRRDGDIELKQSGGTASVRMPRDAMHMILTGHALK